MFPVIFLTARHANGPNFALPAVRRHCDCLASSAPFTNIQTYLRYLLTSSTSTLSEANYHIEATSNLFTAKELTSSTSVQFRHFSAVSKTYRLLFWQILFSLQDDLYNELHILCDRWPSVYGMFLHHLSSDL